MRLLLGDCLDKLKDLDDNSVDSIVTDPPYGLSFMGKKWDYDVPSVEIWEECMRVLKPGGHVLSFAGSRTYHRMAVRIEDAGFEIRDQIMWIYGSGFPKSMNIGHKIDDMKGWGTALKPAHEPIVMARKPLAENTVAQNVLEWGTGGINIDGCRVEFVSDADRAESTGKNQHADFGSTMGTNEIYGDYSMLEPQNYNPPGRFPANVILDEEAGKLLDEQTDSDVGGASRFFYCPKTSKSDRNEGLSEFVGKSVGTHNANSADLENYGGSSLGGASLKGEHKPPQPKQNFHPTVKPTDLMGYLIRLVTPKGGVVLDPFMGSGSTGKAAVREGMGFVGIERESEYFDIAEARIQNEIDSVGKPIVKVSKRKQTKVESVIENKFWQ